LAEVHVRDEVSLATYVAHLPGPPAQLFADPGWIAQPRPVAEWGALARRDGHLSAWPDVVEGFDPFASYITLGSSSAIANDDASLREAVPAFVELARRLRASGPQVLLAAACETDAALMRRVAARTGLPLLGLNVPVEQAIDVLGQARVHVGGRWHPGIFATTGGTPLVAFSSNNHKMRTLMHQLQPEAPVFEGHSIGERIDDVLAEVSRQLDAGDDLRASLKAKAATFATRVESSLDSMQAALDSR
jgi:hypothetical protein